MVSSLRWNKVLRDAWLHKARSVLVVMAIAVGVASFGMVLGSRDAAKVDMYAGYWANVPPNTILYLDSFDEGVNPSPATYRGWARPRGGGSSTPDYRRPSPISGSICS